jgi:hypothetical protein
VGEIFNTIWDAKDLIQNQLIDYIRATIVGAGGITHLRRIADLASLYQIRTGCHGATDLSPVTMGTALHFDTWVPNFGIQEYMRHTPETDEVFPTITRSRRACSMSATHPATASTSTRRWPPSIPTSPHTPRRKAGRWHHVELVMPSLMDRYSVQDTVMMMRLKVATRATAALMPCMPGWRWPLHRRRARSLDQ